MPDAPTHVRLMGHFRPRRARWIGLSLVLLSAAAALFLAEWFFISRPIRRLTEVALHPERFTVDEARKRLHAVLKPPIYGTHDAFLHAEGLGNAETVPLLIEDLRWERVTKPGDMMICTKAHCLESLRKLTGQNPGANYDDWRKWQAEGARTQVGSQAPQDSATARR